MIKGVATGFLAYAFFSTSDAASKALGAHLNVFEILFFLTLASFLTFAFAKPAEERWGDIFRMNRPKLIFLRNGTGIIGSIFGVYSFTTLPLAEAYALIFLVPAFVTILSIPLLGEQVGWRRWLAVIVGFAGVLLVVRPGFRELHLGHATAVLSAALGAVSLITIRKIGRTENRITLLTTLYLSALVVDGLLMLVDFRVPTWHDTAIFTVGGLCGGIGQIAMITAMRLAPSNRIAPTQYSQIVWALIYGAVFFGDFPDAIAIAGIGLVIASGLFTLFREEQLHGWSRRTFLMRNRQ
jgi:drug/metabolite transporter (DMT)-like permease